MSAFRWVPALWMLAAVPASALQLEVTRPELCTMSSHVVVGEVTDVETRWTSDDSGSIERTAHLAVGEVVRGPAVTDLDLHLPGGTIDETTVRVEDVPDLLENGRYLLFLAPDDAGRLVVIGGEQGVVRISGARSRTSGTFDRGEALEHALETVEACRE